MKRIIVISLICLLAAAAHVAAAADGNGKRTTALDSGLWSQSEWISSPDAQVVGGVIADGTRAADGASWFVNTFRNTKKITQAIWMTTSLGINVAYVNGRRVGEEILKPGFTHPLKTKRSFTYDITDMLNRNCGEANTLAVQTTPGWWADKIVTPAGRQGMTGRKTAFRGVLQLTYNDGTTETFGTNTADWLAGVGGPVTHADIFDGEEYDARRPMGFDAIEGFKTPEINTEFQGEILPSEGGEVYFRDDLILNPVEIYVWKDTDGAAADAYGKVHKLRTYKAGDKISLKPGETLVVDFGQNCAGVPEFSFKSEEGANLTCLPGELLNDGNGAHSRGMDGPEGSVHRRNLRIPDSGMILRYTFADSKEASFRPECTFFGYRYVSVSADKPVEISRIVSVPISSISQDMETGTLHTGNELINRLISNTVWGQRSNCLSVPTDCPQRNERLGWMADTHVFAETGSFFADTRDFFRKWMRDVSDTQTETGAYPGVAPWAQYGVEGERMRFGWADAGVIVPWIMLKQFGDTAVVAQSWNSMESFMRHVDETGYDHTKLITENSNVEWADWLSYEPLEWASGGVHMETPEGVAIRPEAFGYWAFLSSCYWLSDAEMMADMAEAIGKDSTPYREMAQKVRRHLQNDLINPDGTFKTEILNTMQTPALFALKNKLVDGDAKKSHDRPPARKLQSPRQLPADRISRHFHPDEHTYGKRHDRRGLRTAFPAPQSELALFRRQRRHHNLGALEQLHGRQGDGPGRYEQLQSLRLRLRVRMAVENRRRHRRRPQRTRIPPYNHETGARPASGLARRRLQITRRQNQQPVEIRRRPLPLEFHRSRRRTRQRDSARTDRNQRIRSRHLHS